MGPTHNRELIRLRVKTQDGTFLAKYSAKGLAQLHFPPTQTTVHWPTTGHAPAEVLCWHDTTKAALEAVLVGRAPRIFPPLDLSAGTPFQQSVWGAMRKIPIGQARSYGEIACAIGNPKGVRAVGGACGANPIPVLVPCHRVLAANGKLGGFSGGIEWKRKLLEREGVKFIEPPACQNSHG